MQLKRALRVVVVSPGDVPEERDAVETVLGEIARHGIGKDRKLTFDVGRWETAAYAGFHLEGGQGICDDVLEIDRADVVIGIFWARFGTLRPDGKVNTEHEIEQAVRAWEDKGSPMPMLFFREAPPPNYDASTLEQMHKVRLFHDRMAPRGMLLAYKEISDFKDQLRKSIEQHIHKVEPLAAGEAAASRASETPYVVRYRARLRHLYADWDLSGLGVALAGGSRPQPVRLDDIYQRLRLAEGYDPNDVTKGAPIGPQDLLKRKKPLLIRGPAGAGKTTWARWMFRRLLERDDALPVFLALRDLTKQWADHGEKPFDETLETCAAKNLGAPSGLLAAITATTNATPPHNRAPAVKPGSNAATGSDTTPKRLTPILLIDGWDELGDLGRKLRERLLGFLEEHEHIRTVVTSRPYGDHVPDWHTGFEVLDLQPLDEPEIRAFAQRFHALCYAEDSSVAEQRASDFWEALSRSQQAGDLARTPLLLTMMLGLSRTRALPEKRHQLYYECLKAMIVERPKRQAQDGVRDWEDVPDGEECFRATAALAWNLQSKRKQSHWGGPLVATTDEMADMLPPNWDRTRRDLFLEWLCERAAVMNRRSDGTLAFAHRSFQEFLTAWDRHQQLEADDRKKFAVSCAAESEWWETIRIWAALLEGDKGRQALQPVLDALIESDTPGRALAGAIFADGLGKQAAFDAWATHLADELQNIYPSFFPMTASAWQFCRQRERRATLESRFAQVAGSARWTQWLRICYWLSSARADYGRFAGLARANRATTANAVLACTLEGKVLSESGYAFGRILFGAGPRWHPGIAAHVLLSLWPSKRRHVGLRLQNLVSNSGEGLLLRVAASSFTSQSEQPSLADLRAHLKLKATDSIWKYSPTIGSTSWYGGFLSDSCIRDSVQDIVYLFPSVLSSKEGRGWVLWTLV